VCVNPYWGAQARPVFLHFRPELASARSVCRWISPLAPGALAVLGGRSRRGLPGSSVSILMPIVAGLLNPVHFLDPRHGKTIRWYALRRSPCSPSFGQPLGPSSTATTPQSRPAADRAGGMAADLGLAWSVGCDGLLDAPDPVTSFITALARCWPPGRSPQTAAVLLLHPGDGWRPDRRLRRSGHCLLFFLAWEAGNCLPVVPGCWRSGGARSASYAATKFILYHPPAARCSSCWRPWPWASRGGAAPPFEYTARGGQGFPARAVSCWATPPAMIAFGVKLPRRCRCPHTWLPDAHGEATRPCTCFAGRQSC